MNVSTRHELQTLLDNIRIKQGTADASPLAYRVAWIALVAAPLVALTLTPLLQEIYWSVSVAILLPIFVQALYTITQYNVNKRLRPILEALLYVPVEQPEKPEQVSEKRKTASKARPTRKRRK